MAPKVVYWDDDGPKDAVPTVAEVVGASVLRPRPHKRKRARPEPAPDPVKLAKRAAGKLHAQECARRGAEKLAAKRALADAKAAKAEAAERRRRVRMGERCPRCHWLWSVDVHDRC